MTADQTLPVVIEEIELGPACQKLRAEHPRRFRFACAIVFEVPAGSGAEIAAGQIAGYAASTSRSLARDKHVIAAVEELARQRLTLDVPLALNTLRGAMSEKYGKDKIKAAQIILDRVVPTKQEIAIKAEPVNQQERTLDYLAHLLAKGASDEMLLAEFGPGGLAHYRQALEAREKAKPIDVEFSVVNEALPAPAAPDAQIAQEADIAEEAEPGELEDIL